MVRPDKVAAVEEITERLSGSAATLLTHYRGLSVTELAELRAALREANADYRVIKNTLTRRAVDAAGMGELTELLEGPTALVFCKEDPVGPAKALKAFAKDHPELVVRGGYLEGEVLDETAAIQLADLASREELLAQLAGLMEGALSGMARLLQAPIEQQARLMQALADEGGYSGADAGAAEAAPTADAEADAPAEASGDDADAPAEASGDDADAPAEAEASGGEEPAADGDADDQA